MKLTFLLGSGISIPAGLPSVGKITNAVLEGDGIVNHKALSTGYVPDEQGEREHGRRIIILLNWLKAQASCRYAELSDRWVNYEDLAYLADQIADDIGYEYENPALQPFVRKALSDLEGMFRDVKPSEARDDIKKLAEAAVTYIRQTVVSQLHKKPKEEDTRYLQFFANACRDESVSEVNLFTLNHDTLIEDFLKNELGNDGFQIVDGLRDASNGDGSRRWEPEVFDKQESDKKALNVFKLHGSIGWIRWEPKLGIKRELLSLENMDRDNRFVGCYKINATARQALYQTLEPGLILVGTFNKILRYNSEVFLELHHRFQRALVECTVLVVCGYGFGDKGVNTRIVEWRRRKVEHRLLIIDPAESSELLGAARGAIQNEIAPIHSVKDCIDAERSSQDSLDCSVSCPMRVGPVKHLRKGVGKRLGDTKTQIATWEEVKEYIQGDAFSGSV